MSLTIQTTPKTFTEGHTTNPGGYGSGKILNGDVYTIVNCGDLDPFDRIRIVQTAAVASSVGPLIVPLATRVHGFNGQFAVSTPSGAAVSADTSFDWMVVKF